jgi:UDP-N-acetylmuramoyl-L-alanyl-D-glutamate--2,6-diaminopimelate ligase
MRTGLSQIQDTSNSKTNHTDERGQDSSPSRVSHRSMKLRDLLQRIEASIPPSAQDMEIRQVACDSRKVQLRALFFALHGAQADGNAFIRDAVSRGAAAIVSEETAPAAIPSSVAWIQVREARKALAVTAANFFGHPAQALQLVAVTGTNGKTTTTSLVDAIIKASGAKTGLFGTIAYQTPLGKYPAPNTTPESVDLQGFLAEIRDAGGRYGVLEASSHSLAMDRLWSCHFAAAVFTNLTREHMDYHKTFEDYFAAKRRLFEGTGAGVPEVAVINTDDEHGKRLIGLAKNTVKYGLESDADITAKKFQWDASTSTTSLPRLEQCRLWGFPRRSSKPEFAISKVFPDGSSGLILGSLILS